MEHYVTLLNSLFLPQCLALHESMVRHVRDYTLWVLCIDDETHDILMKLHLKNVRPLMLRHYETEDLLRVKSERTIGEYCWTLTPFAPRFVFEFDQSVTRVTYIDADLWFRKDPAPIFREFEQSGKAVMITDHSYAPVEDLSATSGQFCVQFMIFTRGRGEMVRKWWEEKCLNWCYARFEDGKFGDQKYLDQWPVTFAESVHILQNRELALAPWNASRYPYGSCIFYHFHALRLVSLHRVEMGNYFIPLGLNKYVYKVYFSDIKDAIERLVSVGWRFQAQATPTNFVKRIVQIALRLRVRILPLISSNQQRL